MSKVFNTSGPCFADLHYMVNIDTRIEQIYSELIQNNMYFTINRARQYGKTTMLDRLYGRLKEQYSVFLLSFADMGNAAFADEHQFCRTFLRLMKSRIKYGMVDGISENTLEDIDTDIKTEQFDLQSLMDLMIHMCSTAKRPVVLMIDEVDQASNNQIFVDFLGILRSMYLQRRYVKTFQSVILVGVYDVKNLKTKIRPDETHKYNSPWNISADFNVNMSFTAWDIADMLKEYEQDHQTGMDLEVISHLIWDYTEGYPFLVSRICQLIDTKVMERTDFPTLTAAWTKAGVLEAVRILLQEKNTLFDDMGKKLADSLILEKMLRSILFNGKSIPYNPDDYTISLGSMFGYLKNKDGIVTIANRIFETRLYNRFLSENITENAIVDAANLDKNQFVENGILNMDLVMKKFMMHFTEIYGNSDDKFLEENGRRIFLMYLRPNI